MPAGSPSRSRFSQRPSPASHAWTVCPTARTRRSPRPGKPTHDEAARLTTNRNRGRRPDSASLSTHRLPSASGKNLAGVLCSRSPRRWPPARRRRGTRFASSSLLRRASTPRTNVFARQDDCRRRRRALPRRSSAPAGPRLAVIGNLARPSWPERRAAAWAAGLFRRAGVPRANCEGRVTTRLPTRPRPLRAPIFEAVGAAGHVVGLARERVHAPLPRRARARCTWTPSATLGARRMSRLLWRTPRRRHAGSTSPALLRSHFPPDTRGRLAASAGRLLLADGTGPRPCTADGPLAATPISIPPVLPSLSVLKLTEDEAAVLAGGPSTTTACVPSSVSPSSAHARLPRRARSSTPAGREGGCHVATVGPVARRPGGGAGDVFMAAYLRRVRRRRRRGGGQHAAETVGQMPEARLRAAA